MSVKFTQNSVSLKNKTTNQFLPIGVFVSEGDKSITEINNFANSKKTEVVNTLENKKNEVLNSMPENYMTLDAAIKKAVTSEKLTTLPELKLPLDEVKQAITISGNNASQKVTDTMNIATDEVNIVKDRAKQEISDLKGSIPSDYSALSDRVNELASVDVDNTKINNEYVKLVGKKMNFNWVIGTDTLSTGTTSVLKSGKRLWSEYIMVDAAQDFDVIVMGRIKCGVAYYDYSYNFLGYSNYTTSSTISKVALQAINKFNQSAGYIRVVLGKIDDKDIVQSDINEMTKMFYIKNSYGSLIDNYVTINGTSLIEDIYNAGYLITNVGIGNTISGDESDIIGYAYKVMDCSEGDEFIITGTTLDDECRLWAFVDENNILLSVANSKLSATRLRIKAPSGAKKIVCDFKCGYNIEFYKVDDTSIEKLVYKLSFNFVTPERYGAIGDGVNDDTSAFASIPEGSYILGNINSIYKIDKIKFTNCVVENCNFTHSSYKAGTTEETKRTYMINAYETTFRNCSFASTCDQIPYLDSSTTGKASNVVAIISKDNTTNIVESCKFYNCFGISLSNSNIKISNSNLKCEMGIYADGTSSVTMNNTNITVLNTPLSNYYHALYIPQFDSFNANECTFEMQSGNTNCGNLVHFYSPNVSTYTTNKAYFNNCTFKGMKNLFRLYIKTIFSNCIIETTEVNSSETLILATSKSLYESIFTDCKFNLMSCRFNVNSVFVKNSDIIMIDGTLYQGTDNKPNYFSDCNIYLGNYNIMLNGRVDDANKITYWINCKFYSNKTTVGIKDFANQSVFKAMNCYSFGNYDALNKTNSSSVDGFTVV